MTRHAYPQRIPGLKRIYEPSVPEDGARILVERLWPRGMSKQRADLRLWMKDIAPSLALRAWFAHDVAKWAEFCARYRDELRQKPQLAGQLRALLAETPVTLVFAAADLTHNSAVVLRDVLVDGASIRP
jgi:uncharacterized protein YeaO (DUF488 family)